MAAKTVFVFVLLLLGASLSSSISLDVKTIQSTDSVPESRLTEKTSVLDSDATFLRLQKDNKLVQTLLKTFESFEADLGKRIKRAVLPTYTLCPERWIRYSVYCYPIEEYKKITNDGDGPEGSDDYVAER